MDRLIASWMGYRAVLSLIEEQKQKRALSIVFFQGKVATTDLAQCLQTKQDFSLRTSPSHADIIHLKPIITPLPLALVFVLVLVPALALVHEYISSQQVRGPKSQLHRERNRHGYSI